jgi:adenylyltransferase/sulfurtransferase
MTSKGPVMISGFSQSELLQYSKQILLPQVGIDGQRKLKQASVLIIGAGGLGSPISLYLAAAGIGRIGIVDPDRVSLSNLQRQVLYSFNMVGEMKVEVAEERLTGLNPCCQIDIFPVAFTSENAKEIAEGYNIIVDGTDNLTTRYLINDLCVLTARPYVYGAIQVFDGQIALFDSRIGPCYRCVFGSPPPSEHIPLPADSGVFGVLPGLVGLLQAAEILKIVLGIGETLAGKLVLINSLTAEFEHIEVLKDPNCPVCGENPEIEVLLD